MPIYAVKTNSAWSLSGYCGDLFTVLLGLIAALRGLRLQILAMLLVLIAALLTGSISLHGRLAAINLKFEATSTGLRWGQGLSGFERIEFIKSHQVFSCILRLTF